MLIFIFIISMIIWHKMNSVCKNAKECDNYGGRNEKDMSILIGFKEFVTF